MGYLINQPVNKQKKRWDFDHYTQSYWYFIRNHHAPVVQKIDNAIQRIRIRETNCTNHWTEIYPMYSAIRLFRHSPLFVRKIVEIERFVLRAAILSWLST